MTIFLTVPIILIGLYTRVLSQTPSCSGGKIFTCGSVCPLTCDNYQNPPACIELCQEGCFCPTGQVEHHGVCVDTDQCPPLTVDGCAVVRCPSNTYCQISNRTGNALCVPDCQINNGGCREDQVCEVVVSNGCVSSDSCDPLMFALCKDPLFVPCGHDAFIACDSEWLYCLQQNKTRRAYCVPSCLSDNGNCGEHEVCISVVRNNEDVTLQCQDRNEISSDCPAGQQINQCGNLCQETCEDIVAGVQRACITVCAPPACVCPPGLVLFRDRCVDPRICYVLMTYPPPINPLPLVGDSQYLYSFISPGTLAADFQQNSFIDAVEQVLTSQGFPDIDVELHGIYQDVDFQIVIKLSGNGVNEDSSSKLGPIFSDNSDQYPIDVKQVSLVKADRVGSVEDCDSKNSKNSVLRVIIISVGGFLLVLLVISVAAIIGSMCKKKVVQLKKVEMDVDEAWNMEELSDEKAKLEFH